MSRLLRFEALGLVALVVGVACAAMPASPAADKAPAPPGTSAKDAPAEPAGPPDPRPPGKPDPKAEPKTKSAHKPSSEGHDPRNPDGSFKYTNRLSKESSPYLRQHQHNPVDWHPWGEDAFKKAKDSDRPVFLSVGYSTCHWCHVMERESFADEAVAELLNKHFICVKVDREERPDVDAVYMRAVQLFSGGHGGWPMTVILAPDRKPFFGATYLPPEDRDGRTGLKSLLKIVHEFWSDPAKRKDLLESGEKVAGILRQEGRKVGLPGELAPAVADEAVAIQMRRYDAVHGGFAGGRGWAPKFPRTTVHMLMFRRPGKPVGARPPVAPEDVGPPAPGAAKREPDPAAKNELKGDAKVEPGPANAANPAEGEAARAAINSLRMMARGGIHDHLAGGFHRYSVDREWLVPHFEKMLYDQALISRACLEAHQITPDAELAAAARGCFDYVLADLRHKDGGFFSAEDADSEGVEGRFYVWNPPEIDRLLGAVEGRLFRKYYGIGDKPNFEEAEGSILHVRIPSDEFAKTENIAPAELSARLAAGRAKLLAVRAKRVRPHLDDKISAGWNGLMIGSLAFGSRVLGEPKYLAAAERAADFVWERLRRADGRLLVTWRDGRAGPAAFLDDHAFLALGMLDLFEATGDPRRLTQAKELLDAMRKLFADPAGGYRLSGTDGERLIAEVKDAYDGAVPSGNSAAALAMARMGMITGDPAWGKAADEVLATFAGEVKENPPAHPVMLMAMLLRREPTLEIVIATPGGDAGSPAALAGESMRREVAGRFLPAAVVIPRGDAGPAVEETAKLVPWLPAQKPLAGKATAYVCRDRSCQAPVHTATDLGRTLERVLGPVR